MFESVDRRADLDGRPLDSHPISSPGAFGSGELKIQLDLDEPACCRKLAKFYGNDNTNHNKQIQRIYVPHHLMFVF